MTLMTYKSSTGVKAHRNHHSSQNMTQDDTCGETVIDHKTNLFKVDPNLSRLGSCYSMPMHHTSAR